MTIDDSPSLRQMVALTLENAGYEVVEAGVGRDAIAKLGGREFHRLTLIFATVP